MTSLYIHIPWCIQKCPYCDFNSHTLKTDLPEAPYLQALERDLAQDAQWVKDREIQSIFIGGGTPSLFSPQAFETLFCTIRQHLQIAENAEITLEANPGTVEQQRFMGFKAAGINRLSLGVQSFQADKLKKLGRIHDDQEAINAVLAAQAAGFSNINIDLMHGLPQQTVADALFDLTTALSLNPTHLSWYQLTLEPNTAFFQKPPTLPVEEIMAEIQQQGQEFLAQNGFHPYEISAYTKAEQYRARHNMNYWLFGDYLGIGAGAHGKITDKNTGAIRRYWKIKHPKAYLSAQNSFVAGEKILPTQELPLEFMMNALRLYQPIELKLFCQRTGLPLQSIVSQLKQAQENGLLQWDEKYLLTTDRGKRFLNDLLDIFL